MFTVVNSSDELFLPTVQSVLLYPPFWSIKSHTRFQGSKFTLDRRVRDFNKLPQCILRVKN